MLFDGKDLSAWTSHHSDITRGGSSGAPEWKLGNGYVEAVPHTGDIATRDEEGHYFVVDRRKDLIITGGFNVYPAEIERVVASHPAVAMVAVGSVPDETHGELARAYVVLRPGVTATEAQVIEHCRPHLAAYKLPRSVRFVPDLPKTSTGKVMRRELKTLDG